MDWENLFDGTGTKQGVPIKIKEQLMSNDGFYSADFAYWFGYKVTYWFGYMILLTNKNSKLKALWKCLSNAASQWPNGSGFSTYCVWLQ